MNGIEEELQQLKRKNILKRDLLITLAKCVETFEWAKAQKGKAYQYAVEDLLYMIRNLEKYDEVK